MWRSAVAIAAVVPDRAMIRTVNWVKWWPSQCRELSVLSITHERYLHSVDSEG